jgi:hypothetical protein
MKVKDLIELLQTYPQELDVVYSLWSEYCLLEPSDIKIINACQEREDNWVARARPDKPNKQYLAITW